MNKIDLVIDMQIDFLRFSIFIFSQKLIVLFSSNKTSMKQKSLTFTHILKRSFTFVIFQLSQKAFSFNQFNKKSVNLIEQLKSCVMTLTNVNSKSTFNLKLFSFSSMNIAMIETTTYRMLVKQLNIKIFAVIVSKID